MGKLSSIPSRLMARLRPSSRVRPRQIPDDLGVEGFFRSLRDNDVRYVVLRWFEELPDVRPGGDVDLLVHDEDITKVEALLTTVKQNVSCDVYSVTGLPGSAYRKGGRELSGVPYFPPHLARGLLERAENRGLYRVPRVEDHFLSLAYHAVYQKGPSSGLPSSYDEVVRDPFPKHDHSVILAKLGREAGVDLPITMESLDDHLASRGWRPPESTLKALRAHNPWVAAHFNDEGQAASRPSEVR